MGPNDSIPLVLSQPSSNNIPLNTNNVINDSDLFQSLKGGESLIKQLIENNQSLSNIKKTDGSKQDTGLNTQQNRQSNELQAEHISDKIDERDIFNTIHSLVTSLRAAIIQIQQLKYKSMIQNTMNTEDIQSRINVEKNLQKQEFERIKSQLLIEKNSLLNKVTVNEKKIKKYKKRIIEKNLEINRLAKLLNENITDITYHDITSIDNSNSIASSSLKQTTIPSTEEELLTIRNNTDSKDTSNMLRTLGALATHVLSTNGDTEENSANRTLLLQHSKVEDDNNTEIEISFRNNNNYNNPMNNNTSDHVIESSNILDNHLTNSTSTPTAKVSHNTSIDNKRHVLNKPLNIPTVQANELRKHDIPKLMPLPKMSSFNTVNGSINK